MHLYLHFLEKYRSVRLTPIACTSPCVRCIADENGSTAASALTVTRLRFRYTSP